LSKEISFKSVGAGDSGQLILIYNIRKYEGSRFYLNLRRL